ncbi:MAG: tRNA pseudouridine(55) synthase TruB [Desulfomonilaceae bacterium]|nr:tRNA pseudouridine(55) synthase TruB [Desulfomonilaceae bacterium]
MHGILLVDKPEGITSNDVVRIVKRIVRPSKVGHTGTLDPAASGLIVILIGSGTRTLDYLDERRKSYSLTVRLGEESDTCDREGTVIRTEDPSGIESEQIEKALESYRGVIDQVPPHYSAIKKEGTPLYKLARKGVFPSLEPRKVEIFSLSMIRWVPPFLDLELVCSKGTYARSLARDIGRDLGVGGRLETLRRTASGSFDVTEALTLDEIESGGRDVVRVHLMDLARALMHIPDLKVTEPELRRLMRGNAPAIARSRLPMSDSAFKGGERLMKIASGTGSIVILVRPEPKGTEIAVRPVKVFNTLSDD